MGQRALLAAGLLWLLDSGVTTADTNTPPAIITQPVSGIASQGEDFAFTVQATGSLPLHYQWRFSGTNLPGATGSSLLLTNLSAAKAGYYAAVVTNISGSVTSSWAQLTVQTAFARRLATDRVLVNQSSQVAVPIVMRGNGRENAVSFSLAYNTNAFANPVFLPGYPNESVTTNAALPGLIGVSILLPPGTQFPPGYITVGLVQFDLTAGANALQGALAFTNEPFPIAAANADQLALNISAAVQPQYVLVASQPGLDRQSGLFKQQLAVSNPGAVVMTNLNILPLTLGGDSLRNRIYFYNGVASLTNFPYNDPLVEVDCNCGCGYALDDAASCDFSNYLACATSTTCALNSATTNIDLVFAQISNLAPAETRTLTLEFYVSDHFTLPPVTYSLYLSDPVQLSAPTTGTPLTITTNRYVNGTFMIEFPTRSGYYYYVQYADNTSFTNAAVAFPAVPGTGSRVQWIDDGPPKTTSPPVNGSRFYRVFQSP